jgi:hypothetical protein
MSKARLSRADNSEHVGFLFNDDRPSTTWAADFG